MYLHDIKLATIYIISNSQSSGELMVCCLWRPDFLYKARMSAQLDPRDTKGQAWASVIGQWDAGHWWAGPY